MYEQRRVAPSIVPSGVASLKVWSGMVPDSVPSLLQSPIPLESSPMKYT